MPRMSTATFPKKEPVQLERRRELYPGARTLLALGVAHALLECYSGVWPVYKNLANLDLTTAGIIAAGTTLLAATLQPAFGHWSDRGWARSLVLWGTALSFLMCLLGPAGAALKAHGEVTHYGVLALLLLFSRLGHSMFHPAGAALASQTLQGRRNAGLGIFSALGWAGYAFSQVTFSAAYLRLDGHTEILALPGVVLMVWIVACCPRSNTLPTSNDSLRQKLAAMWKLRGEVGTLFVLLCMLWAVNMAFFFLLPELLESKGYTGWIVHGGAHAFIMAGTALGVVLGGYAADRFGVRRMLMLFMVLTALAYQGFLLLPKLDTAALVPLCVLTGLICGAGQPLPLSMGQQLAPNNTSLISGVMLGWTWTFGCLTQPLAGWLAEQPAIGLVGALSLMGTGNVVAVVLAASLCWAPKSKVA